MASPAENFKAVCGEASRHTCTASPVHYNLDHPKFFVPTGHYAGERWPHADLGAQHPRACSSGRPHLRHLRIGQSPLSMKHGDEIGRAAYYLRSCFRTNVPQDQECRLFWVGDFAAARSESSIRRNEPGVTSGPPGQVVSEPITVAAVDALAELVRGDEVHQLGEDRPADVHGPAPLVTMREYGPRRVVRSNR